MTLIPYTRSYMYQATQTGMPVMRALVFAYPEDETLSDTWDEYLYGRDILVAPVATAASVHRKVYLPAGRWMNYEERRTIYRGKTTITADAGLAEIPLFVREGAIIPRGHIVQLNNNWDAGWTPRLRIEMFPARSLVSEFPYFTGRAVQTIKMTAQNGGITIGFGDLGVKGVLEIYCRPSSEVQRDGRTLRSGTDYQYDAGAQKLTVPFDGATTLQIKGVKSLF